MSRGPEATRESFGARLFDGLAALAMLAVVLVYADRIFLDLPLYAGDEGAYLIHALYGKALAADPTLSPDLQSLNNTAFLLVIRAVTYVSTHLLEWMRALGACAYVGGIILVWLSVKPALTGRRAATFLLLALAFPYYRFVVAVMPEGWYVGLLGLMILLTARLYLSRPVLHALVVGALAGVLVLLKPHGAAVVAAFGALAALDLIWGRREPITFLLRLGLFALAFLAAGNLLDLMAGEPVTRPLTFFIGGHYAKALGSEATPASLMIGARAAVLLAATALLLTAPPVLAGLLSLAMRRVRGRLALEAKDVAFLLVLLSFAATLAMTAIFTMKAITYGPDEANRLWGRYFEFFTPLLWLTAAPFLLEQDRHGGRWWRIAAGAGPVIGVAGVGYFLLNGVMLFPWDSTAMAAFARPDPSLPDAAPAIPYFAIAVGATLAAGLATAATAWPTHRIWMAHIVVLALLSTTLDRAWERAEAANRRALEVELMVASRLAEREPGRIGAVVDDFNVSHNLFRALGARPHMILVDPDADIGNVTLADYDMVIVAGPHDLIGGDWRPLFEGRRLSVFRRAAAMAEAQRLGLAPGTR